MINFYKDENVIITKDEVEKELIPVQREYNEKHTPIVSVQGDTLSVNVNHGMSEEHFIAAIVYEYEDGFDVVRLNYVDEPKAVFTYMGKGKVYTYCNLHGVYETDVE